MIKEDYKIREMTIEDYDAVFAFWQSIDGLRMDESDTKENLSFYLKRNPHLSYIVLKKDRIIIGTIKSGQDGRRGYINHLAIDKKHQKLGLAKKLYNICLEEFKRQGIYRCNLYVLQSNTEALSFWEQNGWNELEVDYKMLQKKIN